MTATTWMLILWMGSMRMHPVPGYTQEGCLRAAESYTQQGKWQAFCIPGPDWKTDREKR